MKQSWLIVGLVALIVVGALYYHKKRGEGGMA